MVFKIEKTKNYTVMSNYHLQDKNISFKAKGLLSFMLSLPEDWDYSLAGLVSVSKENTKAIRTILNELKDNGYLVIEQTRGDKGYYKYNYIIYEQPITIEKDNKSPDTRKGYAVVGDAEVQMVAGGNAGGAGSSNLLTRADDLPGRYVVFAQVHVDGREAVLMVDLHVVAGGIAPARYGDDARTARVHAVAGAGI